MIQQTKPRTQLFSALVCGIVMLTALTANAQEQQRSSDATESLVEARDGSTTTARTDLIAQKTVDIVASDFLPIDDRVNSKRPVDGEAVNNAQDTQQPAPPSEWEFAFTPYLFTAGLSGRVGARGRSVEVDASFSDVWDHFEFGLMGTFEGRKGNWGFLIDTMYISLSSETTTPGLLFSGVNSKSKLFIVDPELSYRLLNLKGGSIDLLAGVRIWHLKNSLTFLPGLLAPQVDVSESKNWADPVVGGRGVVFLSPRLFLNGKFDVGGFGIGSEFTGQAYGGAGINVKPRVALIGGYRYLYVDYKNEGFIFKTAMKGLVFGATFKF